jgi:hypothetical protein
MRTIIAMALVALALSSYGQVVQNKEYQEIDLRLSEAGKALKGSAALAGIGMGGAIIGSAIATTGAFIGNPDVIVGGAIVSAVSIPLGIASISMIGRAGTSLENAATYKRSKQGGYSDSELERLRRENEQYLQEQKRKEKENK